ncbi:50S ribosomal protein L22 [Patescibacteria group bacterium]|nr:50S ribosomal protein L22 [Patescibacteria group bacterium]MBU2509476.1 50S ribosomal protein L22 [Patescibacteria group bacterium]
MEVKASLRRLHMAPRKVRLVVDLVRGLPVKEAVLRLSFLQKEAALPVLKLLKSAMANAEHNFKLDSSDLVVKSITADGGMTLKRWRPRAFGRAAPIRKRTTHINIVLAQKEAAEKLKTKSEKGITAPKVDTEKPSEKKLKPEA